MLLRALSGKKAPNNFLRQTDWTATDLFWLLTHWLTGQLKWEKNCIKSFYLSLHLSFPYIIQNSTRKGKFPESMFVQNCTGQSHPNTNLSRPILTFCQMNNISIYFMSVQQQFECNYSIQTNIQNKDGWIIQPEAD